MFQADLKRAIEEVGVVLVVPHTIGWKFLRKKLYMFPYLLQIRQGRSEADKEYRVAFAQLCEENMEENLNFLERIVFSEECSFLWHGAVNKENCRNRGFKRPKTVYESLQSSLTLMVW